MACAFGFMAYRWEAVDHPVPVRVIGPDGRQDKQLCRAVSWIWDRCKDKDKKRAKRWINALLWALNRIYNSLPADRVYDVAAKFVGSVGGCRQVQDGLFVALKITMDDAVENDGSYWVKPSKAKYANVADAVVAFGLATRALFIAGIFDRDASKVDRAVSRVAGKGAEYKVTRRGIRLDTDRRIRLSYNADHAPRYDDPRFYARLKVGLAKTGATQCTVRACALAFVSGARFVSVSSLSIFDILVGSPEACHYPTRNKGDTDDARSFTMIVSQDENRRLFEYVAGERARLSGHELEKLRWMARNPEEHDLLRAMPVLTPNGCDPLGYNQLWRELRRAAVEMDLFIDDEEYRATRKKRYLTFHYLRHEYVHRRMDRMRKMKTKEARAAERADIMHYMKWQSEAMLDWYSAHHKLKHSKSAAQQAAEDNEDEARRPMGIDASNDDADFEMMQEALA